MTDFEIRDIESGRLPLHETEGRGSRGPREWVSGERKERRVSQRVGASRTGLQHVSRSFGRWTKGSSTKRDNYDISHSLPAPCSMAFDIACVAMFDSARLVAIRRLSHFLSFSPLSVRSYIGRI